MTSSRRRVAIVHNTLWSHYKGFVFSELATILARRETDLLVIQQSVTERMRRGLGEIDVDCHRYPFVLLEEGSLDEVSWPRRTWRLGVELMRFDPDAVVVPGYSDVAYWGALVLSVLEGKRRILAFDSTLADRPRRMSREWVKRLFVSAFDMAFCYGEKSKTYLERLGMPPEAIRIRCQATANDILEKVHREAAASREELRTRLGLPARCFIYVGRLSREKNLRALVAAFAEIKRAGGGGADWGLILVGDGPERATIMRDVDERKLRDVRLAGGVGWRQVPEWFALSDVLVLPSESEPWGLVVNEAMACGVVPIVSDCCGAADDLVVNGDAGFVFQPHDHRALCEAMSRCVGDAELLSRMSGRCRQVIAEYTPGRAAERMANGIEEVLA